MTPAPHPVPELIFARAEARSRPGERTDGCRLGLALEGGGMREVVSAGMVCALERLGLLEAFDAVYGSSSGAINGAFFVAGQTDYGIPLYWENIANRRFINYLRLASKTPVLSLEYLLEHVMVREKILDWQAVVGSPVPPICSRSGRVPATARCTGSSAVAGAWWQARRLDWPLPSRPCWDTTPATRAPRAGARWDSRRSLRP